MPDDKRPSSRYLDDLTWEEKAKENPLYAVMSVGDFVDSGSAPTEEELEGFFENGREKVGRWILPWLCGIPAYPDVRVLEFGCGMGRLLKALAPSCPNCCGVDISPTMIEHAARHLPPDVTVKLLEPIGRIPFEDNSFDCVFSYAVLQHIRQKSVVCNAIREIGRVLKPGGHVKIQIAMVNLCFEKRLRPRGDSHAFENFTVYWGRARRLPVWRINFLRHSHWGGARLGYGQLDRQFREAGIWIDTLHCDRSNPRIVWFMGRKMQESGDPSCPQP